MLESAKPLLFKAMGKRVTLDLDGNLEQGASVTLEIRNGDNWVVTRTKGRLPPAPLLRENCDRWQSLYRTVSSLYRLEDCTEQVTRGCHSEAIADCRQAAQTLAESLTDWLASDSFRPIREKLLEKLPAEEEVQLVLHVENHRLRRLPWYVWDLFARYPKLELALSAPAYEGAITAAPTRERVRILAILGNRDGIDLESDRQVLENLPDGAETVFLVEPQRRELYRWLWHPLGWDILCFAGHSSSRADGTTGQIELNKRDRLTIDELACALKKAIERGLKLAIFNSCDGLGLARALENLHLPQIVVMREPVPDLVAQEFLKAFLTAFCRGQSLYVAAREAREQLQSLEDTYPCASWLPILCQNPAAAPVTWHTLGANVQNPPCPYRGLSAFQEADAPFFFGREALTERLVEVVHQRPLVPIIGASGSGKSSVVLAGLIPRLRLLQNWLIVDLRPGNRPFTRLAEALISHLESPQSETDRLVEVNKLASALDRAQLSLADVVERILTKHPTADRILIAIDQFEELYTLCSSTAPFLDTLLAAIQQTSNLTITFTIRADFCEYLLSSRPLAEALQQFPPEFLSPMTREELQAAVEKPALTSGVALAPGLAERILLALSVAEGDTIQTEPGQLPLLEFALTLLWERSLEQEGAMLTHAAYEAIGGVTQALAQYADRVYTTLAPEAQQQAQQIFIQLVHPGEGTADTRRLATRGEVGQANWRLVGRLADARLVVSHRDETTGEETVEIVHEALIREWRRLQQWLAADRNFRLWQERLRHTLRQWEASARDEGALLRGALLLEACRWREERADDLTLQEQHFIEASLALQRRERLGRTRLRRRVRYGLAGGLAGALVLVGVAMWQWQRAETGDVRDRLNAAIAFSEELLASNKELEALMEGTRAARQLQQLRAVNPDIRMRAIAVLQQAVYGVRELNRLEGHDRSVLAVSFSPDGQLIVSGSDDKTVKLWHRDGKLIQTLTDHQERVRSVSFSPDGQHFASASYDGTVNVWRRDGTLLNTLDGHRGEVNRVSFSPDGQFLASAGADGTVKLWRRDGTLVETLQGHGSWVTDVRFSPDGQLLASSSTDRTIKLWHREGRLLVTLKGHQGAVNGLSFSPDGQTLASASTDGTVKLWRRDGTLVETLTEHRDRVWDVSFSPDGQTLASASADKTVKLWQRDGTPLATLQGHHASIYNISFSPDGQTIASASADVTIRLWHRERRQPSLLTGHEAAIGSIRYSPDGQILASASADKTVKLWHADGTLLATLRGHRDGVNSLGFSPDGQILASGSADGIVKLWYPDGRSRQTFQGHRGSILGVSFSPDGQTVASASADGTVKLWNLQGRMQVTIAGHQGQVNQVSFSPDGQLLATASGDETIKLWHADGKLRNTLKGHQADVLGVSFSPDGEMLASASTDGTVKLWSRRGRLLKTLKGHTNRVNRVSFSPDGQTLVSASEDGTVKLWSRSGTLLKPLVADGTGVVDARFSPDGQTIAAASRDSIVLWNANLEALLTMSCTWMQDYLETNMTLPSSDRRLCYP